MHSNVHLAAVDSSPKRRGRHCAFPVWLRYTAAMLFPAVRRCSWRFERNPGLCNQPMAARAELYLERRISTSAGLKDMWSTTSYLVVDRCIFGKDLGSVSRDMIGYRVCTRTTLSAIP